MQKDLFMETPTDESQGSGARVDSPPCKAAVYAEHTRKPEVPPPDPDAIPAEMRDAGRWVLWRLVWKEDKKGGGKWNKVPFRANGRKASSTDAGTWATFDEVAAAYRAGGFDGVGFVLGEGWAGIDLDDVRHPATAELTADAAALVAAFATHAEASPSGTGVKLVGRGEWRAKWHRKPFPGGGEIEGYSAGRYFTVTGRAIGGHPVAEIQPALDALAARFAAPKADEPWRGSAGPGGPADDDELLRRARDARNGAKFRRLWDGDASDHGGDESRADLALCGMLAFWCGGDAQRIDALFRRSGLMRPKWDERHGEATYGERTIAKALDGRTEFYDPDRGHGGTGGDGSDEKVDPNQFTESGYTVAHGSTYHCVLTRDPKTNDLLVAKRTRLANFSARIVGETVHDDGAEPTREFDIAVEQRGKPAVTTGVPVERFASLDWVVERCGPRLVIQAGSGKRDHLRCAIQEMSADPVPSTTVFRHTGWREVGGRWCYLHGDGAITDAPDGAAVAVQLDGAASGFRLPPSPTGEQLRAAVRASLRILDGLVPDGVAFPLLATVYRAALGPSDYALWLAGPTGSQKSELAALGQQHYGAGMARNRLPGNWASTDNALEGLAFTVKDAVLVIDDFAPPPSRADADRQHRTAERLIRGQGNSAGRQRMRADGTLRPPKPPRGLILATGEDVPRGHSITARLCVVDVERGSVKLKRLSECQRDAAAGVYASAMGGFAVWLAPRYAELPCQLDAERVELRNQFVGKFPHARTPDVVANLLTGLRYLLRFAEHVGAIDRDERERLWERGLAAFRAAADRQGEHQRAADPVARFPEMLGAVLSSGRGHVAGRDGREPNAPPSPEAWGWEGRPVRSGSDEKGVEYRGRGNKVGWVDGDKLYLDPDSAFAAISELARDQGQAYPVSQQTLFRRVKEAGLLLRTDGDRTTYPETLEGVRRRVLVLPACTVAQQPGQPGRPGRGSSDAAEPVPESRPGSGGGAEEPGHEAGTEPLANTGDVPGVPVVPTSAANGRPGPRRFRSDDRTHEWR
jgi:primase-polymerase (primpol)-like protein